MLETLTGRLKWEQSGDGIRVVIPARLSWGAISRLLVDLGVCFVTFLGLFLIVDCVAILRGLGFHSYLHSEAVHNLYRVSLGYCAGLILARMVPRLFGKTTVMLSPAQITIEWNMRLRCSKEAFATATLHSFRFVERSGEVPVQNKIGQNEVQFGQSHWIRRIGEGVTREEAEALIAKLTEVYPFPRYLPSESATGAETKRDAHFLSEPIAPE